LDFYSVTLEGVVLLFVGLV